MVGWFMYGIRDETRHSGAIAASLGLTSATLGRSHAAGCLAEGSTMGKKIALGFLATTLCAAPVEAEPANPATPAITKPNNDATLRAPHAPPPAPYRAQPKIESAPTGQRRPVR
ncbi:MAG: hypothetical protein ACK463_17410 [Bradyrhizobium sp.]